jgi:hypothetical protein
MLLPNSMSVHSPRGLPNSPPAHTQRSLSLSSRRLCDKSAAEQPALVPALRRMTRTGAYVRRVAKCRSAARPLRSACEAAAHGRLSGSTTALPSGCRSCGARKYGGDVSRPALLGAWQQQRNSPGGGSNSGPVGPRRRAVPNRNSVAAGMRRHCSNWIVAAPG